MKKREQKIEWSILLHDIRSVQNVASIFRMAECLGVKNIYLSGLTPGPFDRFKNERKDFKKISLGAEEFVKFERIGEEIQNEIYSEETSKKNLNDCLEFILKFKKEGGVVLALEQSEDSLDYKNLKIEDEKKYLIIPGKEREGLEKIILENSDFVLEIPQYGKKESLNIFSALSVSCFRFFDKN